MPLSHLIATPKVDVNGLSRDGEGEGDPQKWGEQTPSPPDAAKSDTQGSKTGRELGSEGESGHGGERARRRARKGEGKGGGVRGRERFLLDLTVGDRAGKIARRAGELMASWHAPADLERHMKSINRRNRRSRHSTAGGRGGEGGGGSAGGGGCGGDGDTGSRRCEGVADEVGIRCGWSERVPVLRGNTISRGIAIDRTPPPALSSPGVRGTHIPAFTRVGSEELAAHVVSVRHGLRALPRLVYADKHVRASLAMSLLPESYTDTLSALLAHVIHPSPAVCAEVAALWALQQDRGMHSAAGSWCGRSGEGIRGKGAGDGGRWGGLGKEARRGEQAGLFEGW